jgi:membrane-bound lytic murein transglycosylase D
LKRAQETQGVSRFWDLDLYTEAERYFPRTLAIKAVMSDLPGHDFALDVEDGWAPRPHGYVKLDVPEGVEIPVLAAAKGAGIPPRTLRAYNPEMGKADHLPHGREVVVEVPQGKERALRDWVAAEVERARALAKSPAKPKARGKKTAKRGRGAEAAASSKAVAKASKRAKRAEKRSKRSAKRAKRSRPRTYTIRAGDSLWSIAQRKNVSVADLRKWNKLGRTDVIAPGQELLVEARR